VIQKPLYLWTASVIIWVGAVGATGVIPQKRLSLTAPLGEVVPTSFDRHVGSDVEISLEEQEAAGFTDYLFRSYDAPAPSPKTEAAVASELPPFSVYVGYYDGQSKGKTIHSPKNCLPGSGWEALGSSVASVDTPTGTVEVNRYLLQNGDERALVLYWYQGRGRVQANEYMVKWDLLRDAALMHRSEEALVRIVVPIVDSEEASFDLANRVAERLVPALDNALPD
jgi:EpsI family protein